MFVFVFGFLTCIISIIRLRNAVVVGKIGSTKNPDLIYTNLDTALWNAIELNTAMICACFPPLSPLFSRCIGAIHFTSKHTNPQLGISTITRNHNDTLRP
jgi:hypothetical protein